MQLQPPAHVVLPMVEADVVIGQLSQEARPRSVHRQRGRDREREREIAIFGSSCGTQNPSATPPGFPGTFTDDTRLPMEPRP